MTDLKSNFRLTENAWLAIIPVVASYLAFVFQVSYFAHFGVPASMVDIDISKFIFSLTALALGALLVVLLFAAVADLLSSQNPVIQIIGSGLAGAAMVMPFILVAIDAFTEKQLTTYGLIFFVLWLTKFWPPPQKKGESKSYIERLGEREMASRGRATKAPRNVKQLVGTHILAPFSLIAFLTIYIAMLGTFFASAFGGSMHLKGNPDAIYVGRTSGAYIFAILDQRTNSFGKSVLIIDAGSNLELVRSVRKRVR